MIIEIAHKIISKQGKSVMLDFLQIVAIYASKLWMDAKMNTTSNYVNQ